MCCVCVCVCVLVLTHVNNRSLHNRHHKDSALLFPELFSKKVSSYTFHSRQYYAYSTMRILLLYIETAFGGLNLCKLNLALYV